MKDNKDAMVQTFNWGRVCLAVSRDTSGDLTVVEHDGEGITIRAWKLAHLVHLAQQWDDKEHAKKFDKEIARLESKILTLEKAYGDLFTEVHHSRWWKF